MKRFLLLTSSIALSICPQAIAQETKAEVQSIQGNIVRPHQLPASDENVSALKFPDGVKVEKFAEGLINPRILAISSKGRIYVSRRMVGDLVMLEDTDSDRKADRQQVVASRPNLHGVAIDGDTLFFTTVKDIFSAQIREDGTLGELTRIVDNLPDGGQHPNRTLAVGPDDMLYVSIGSTCNACAETNQEHATLLRMKKDGSDRKVFASGLRNTIGFGWTGDGQLYGMDQGIDFLGDNSQMEELNKLEEGKKYGWPYAFDDNQINHQPPPPQGMKREEWAAQSEVPVLLYQAHSAAMQMAFAPDRGVPEEYQGDAFVAMRGSWNRNPPSGYEIVRIDFENGRPVRFEPFISGFLRNDSQNQEEAGHFGRPVGVAFAPSGAMFISDDTNGVIYRVSFEADPVRTGTTAPANDSLRQADQDQRAVTDGGETQKARQETPTDLATDLLDAAGGLDLQMSSDAFKDGESIPLRYSEYGEGISIPLAWSDGPEGTKSYAILMEDPDVPENVRPFVHWIAYNVPASTRKLPPGLPQQPKLLEPAGVMQGANSAGRIGYMGPMPPIGDDAHSYHVQIFALDRQLDLPAGADRKQVLDAMRGHILAMGEIEGEFEARENINAATDPQPDGNERLD